MKEKEGGGNKQGRWWWKERRENEGVREGEKRKMRGKETRGDVRGGGEGEMRRGGVPDVALAHEDTSVVDGLGEMELVDEGLQSPLHEILVFQTQDEIELVLALIQDTKLVESAEEGSTFEESLGVFLLELEKLTSCLAHL